MSQPDLDPDAVRAELAAFDERQKKIVGGVVAVMIQNPEAVRDREWISEQFTQVTLLACGFEDLDDAQEGLTQVQEYARENIGPILNACFRLFLRVAADMQERDGPTQEEAVARALDYFQ